MKVYSSQILWKSTTFYYSCYADNFLIVFRFISFDFVPFSAIDENDNSNIGFM